MLCGGFCSTSGIGTIRAYGRHCRATSGASRCDMGTSMLSYMRKVLGQVPNQWLKMHKQLGHQYCQHQQTTPITVATIACSCKRQLPAASGIAAPVLAPASAGCDDVLARYLGHKWFG
eukprot:GHRR01035640.1.p2 GENE.GHRR01035640.1~~GHRR01035640.1.p2  ORF type:complete len:118 (-),score=29.78 GHRR01035640.1:568-921(-)